MDTGFKAEATGQGILTESRLVAIPATELARRRLHPRAFNMIMLGAAAALMDAVDLDGLREALEEKLSRYFKRDPRLREQNFKGLDLGFELASRDIADRPQLQEVLNH